LRSALSPYSSNLPLHVFNSLPSSLSILFFFRTHSPLSSIDLMTPPQFHWLLLISRRLRSPSLTLWLGSCCTGARRRRGPRMYSRRRQGSPSLRRYPQSHNINPTVDAVVSLTSLVP